MLKLFPKKEQWVSGSVGEMRRQVHALIKSDRKEKAAADASGDRDDKARQDRHLSWKKKYLDLEQKYKVLEGRYKQLERDHRELHSLLKKKVG